MNENFDLFLPAGEDFTSRNASSPQILFSPDDESKEVNISILQDQVEEETETFFVSLELTNGPVKIDKADHVNVTVLDSECT